jgi:hypothetical protein
MRTHTPPVAGMRPGKSLRAILIESSQAAFGLLQAHMRGSF